MEVNGQLHVLDDDDNDDIRRKRRRRRKGIGCCG
jgi:hypothetical protein